MWTLLKQLISLRLFRDTPYNQDHINLMLKDFFNSEKCRAWLSCISTNKLLRKKWKNTKIILVVVSKYKHTYGFDV